MTMSFALSPNHDLVIDRSGKLVLVTGADEVRQRVLVALLHDYQEYFLNTPAGVPWHEVILGSKDLASVAAVLRQIVLSVPGVLSIASFALGLSGRMVTVKISIEVDTGAGDTDIIDVVSNLSTLVEDLALNQNHTYLTDDAGTYLTDESGNFLVE